MRFVQNWWLAMGGWRWLNIVPILLSLYLATGYEAMGRGWQDHGIKLVGDNEIQLYTRGAIRAGESLAVRIVLAKPETLTIGFSQAYCQLLSPESDSVNAEFETVLRLSDEIDQHAILTISNDHNEASWNLGRLIL